MSGGGETRLVGEAVRPLSEDEAREAVNRWSAKGLFRIKNLGDGAEKPPGEWNRMVIECRGRAISIWVNDTLVNAGTDCTTDHGQIALQAEGAVCEFRRVDLTRL